MRLLPRKGGRRDKEKKKDKKSRKEAADSGSDCDSIPESLDLARLKHVDTHVAVLIHVQLALDIATNPGSWN